ncbi:hypothetical protein TYRP_017620 [Tyrophagus putrescentiae]|nr:hypothetical protein TYRP_017620 [Tyrophagus putrescentiae]
MTVADDPQPCGLDPDSIPHEREDPQTTGGPVTLLPLQTEEDTGYITTNVDITSDYTVDTTVVLQNVPPAQTKIDNLNRSLEQEQLANIKQTGIADTATATDDTIDTAAETAAKKN